MSATIHAAEVERPQYHPGRLPDLDPRQVAEVLDREHIAVRAGMPCCHPLMRALDLSGVIRASFSIYDDEEAVDLLIAGLERAIPTLKGKPATAIDPMNPCGRPQA